MPGPGSGEEVWMGPNDDHQYNQHRGGQFDLVRPKPKLPATRGLGFQLSYPTSTCTATIQAPLHREVDWGIEPRSLVGGLPVCM